MNSITFNIDQLERLFPFYLLVNSSMQITASGKSLRKLIPISEQCHFNDCFHVLRPENAGQDFQTLRTHQEHLIILQTKRGQPLMLRGQLESLNEENVLFIGSPWFSSMDEVKERGLVLNDFAYHDPLIDLLHVIKTQEIATTEVKSLLQKVNEQKNQLKKANKAFEDIALFPMQNPDPILRLDFEGNITLKNPAAQSLLISIEYNGKSFTNESFWKTILPEIREHGNRHIVVAMSGNRYFSFVCNILESEGYINIYGRDITSERMLDQDLKHSAKRLSTLISNLQSGVLLENENRTIALANQQFCTMFSIPAPPEALIGADCSNAAEQSKSMFRDPDGFIKRINELLQHKQIAIGDKLELANGSFYSRDFIPIWQEELYLGHMWVYRDITAEETGKQAMEEQRAFYEQILNKIPADIAVFDKEHRYLFVNPLAIKDEEMRRWIIGKKDEDYLRKRNKPLELMEERNEIFKRVIRSGKLESFEESFPQSDGSVVHHLRNFFPVVNDKGEVELMIGYGLNITERKKMEQALEAAMQKAEKEAELKDRFFATMSHEIRTPLNGILGITELLAQTKLNVQQQEYIQMMKASGDHLLRIVNDVLDFEKITNNKIQLEHSEFDLVQTIEDICRIFRVNAEEKGLNFHLHTQQDQLWVKADAYRLSQVLHNLCGNAVKFTQQGGVEVTVSSTGYKNNTADISITVKDTGIGIEPELQQTIFEPYAQGKTFIARQYGGTGLGLAISKKLVELLGGSIHVKSEPGMGSSFTLEFHWPMASATAIANEKHTHSSIVPATPLHVLVAEDAPINQYLIRHILEKWGCTFFLAENGKAAVEAVKHQHFDLVLMDIEMPLMDGIEATHHIRSLADKDKASLPIIALTANAIKGNREQYLSAGMNEYITKPFQEQQLLEAIRSFVHHAPMRESHNESKLKNKSKRYDLSYLQSLSADEAFVQEMISLYIKTTPELVQNLTAAALQRNTDKLSKALHKLKPAASTIGLEDVKKSIEAIEELIKAGKTDRTVFEKAEAVGGVFNECIQQLKSEQLK